MYVTNLDEYKSIGTHSIVLHKNSSHDETYFDSFGVGHIAKEIKKELQAKIIEIFLKYKHTIQECVDAFY